jgi:hypothetical protein
MAACLVNNQSPPLQDLNGLFYWLSSQLGYICQTGIPEWETNTVYYIGSIVSGVGNGIVYISLTDSNTGNAVTNTTYWMPLNMGQFNKSVGAAAGGAQYSTLGAAISAASTGDTILIRSSQTFTSDLTVNVSDLYIKCMPGVTLTFNSGCTNGLIFTSDRITFEGSLVAGTSLTSLLYLNSHDGIVRSSRLSATSGTITEAVLVASSKNRNYIEASIYNNGGTFTTKISDSGTDTDYQLRGNGT